MSIFPTLSITTGTGTPRFIKEISPAHSEYYLTPGTPTYSSTACVDSVTLDARVKAGKRIRAVKAETGQAGVLCWGKIAAVDLATKTITVDRWIGGVPTNGNTYTIDGWIGDLPRCEELREIFTPEVLVHNLWKGRKATKLFGYHYHASLKYSGFSSPEILMELRDILFVVANSGDEEILFIPRNDKPGINHKVYITDDFEFILHPSQYGYTGLVLSLEGKELIALPQHFGFSGYGTGFAANYGSQF